MNTENKETKVGTLVLSPVNRINPDIAKWRMALRSAENPTNPIRSVLYDVYEETMLDGMVTSVTERLAIKCTTSKIIFSKDGKADTENPISKMVQSPEFMEFIKYIIESKWWGHSLVEFDFKDQKISKISLIPRKNVVPERGIVTLRVNDATGTEYRNPPYTNYLVEIGGERDLGLLNKATPYSIYKRMGMANWGEFIELFGVPIRQFEYDANNPNARKEVEEQAKKHGASATIIMPSGTKMNVIKGGDGSGNSAVFKDYKLANDEEILLIFLLQTMTTLDGSSRSQGEVHERSEDDLISAYKLFVELVLNYKFLPLLAKHGFDVENGRFQYDDKRELSKKELLEIIQGLAQFGDVPLDFIEKHFGIKLSPKEKAAIQKLKLKDRYSLCSHVSLFYTGETAKLNNISKEETQLLKRIYNANGKYEFDHVYFSALSVYLKSGIGAGFEGRKNIDYNSPDHLTKTLMELNVAEFSATKDSALVNELNAMLRDAESFADFEEQAAGVLQQYNENWLKAEYELAHSTALNTANYLRNMEVAGDFPYWEYSTVGDDRVREEHAALHGKMFLAGQMGAFTPPNGWGCRCDIIPRVSLDGKELLDEDGAIVAVGEEGYKTMQKGGFAINRAEQSQVFTTKQFYVQNFDMEALSFVDFGLKSYKDIQANAPKQNIVKRNKEDAQAWFDARKGQNGLDDENNIRLVDYQKRPVLLPVETLLNNDYDVLQMLEDTVAKPDEVYISREGKSYFIRHIKHYAPAPLVVEMSISPRSKAPKILAYYTEKNPDKQARKGLLFHKD